MKILKQQSRKSMTLNVKNVSSISDTFCNFAIWVQSLKVGLHQRP